MMPGVRDWLHRFAMTARPGFGRGRNPLRRRSDRVQAVIALVAVLLVVALVPTAVIAGVATWRHFSTVAEQESGSRHLVAATVSGTVVQSSESRTQLSELSWTYPDEVEHTGKLTLAQPPDTGGTVSIWVDDSGEMSPAPLTATNVWIDTLGLVVTLLLVGLLLAFGWYRGSRRLLDRRRARHLDEEWRRFNQSRSGGYRDTHG